MSTGIIILAAGNSSRLGRPKQLLSFKKGTLLSNTIRAAKESLLRPIIVVLGAKAEEIYAKNKSDEVHFITNPNWHMGLSSSISAGVNALLNLEPKLQNIIVSVSDQPFIEADIFTALRDKKGQSAKTIVTSTYAQAMGAPTLFNQRFFQELCLLTGDTGAKSIIQKNQTEVDYIAFDLGEIDIDTEEDYLKLEDTKT
ncbi:nucleotidyltransferase family protein [Pedobacter sp. MW01-1-1]|uniref:nucleotidyltransferase family protein n=1 Tax=Pedobacter sp. MW01-1-1 TaxID=3383027 RepID=UPI003FF0D13E